MVEDNGSGFQNIEEMERVETNSYNTREKRALFNNIIDSSISSLCPINLSQTYHSSFPR